MTDHQHTALTALAGKVWNATLDAADRRMIRHGFHRFEHLLEGEQEIIVQLLGAATVTAAEAAVRDASASPEPPRDSRPAPEDRQGVEDFINAVRLNAVNTALPPASELTGEDVAGLKRLLEEVHESGHEHERENGALLIRTHDLGGNSTAVEVCTPRAVSEDGARYLLALSLLNLLTDDGEHGLIRTALSAYVEHLDA